MSDFLSAVVALGPAEFALERLAGMVGFDLLREVEQAAAPAPSGESAQSSAAAVPPQVDDHVPVPIIVDIAGATARDAAIEPPWWNATRPVDVRATPLVTVAVSRETLFRPERQRDIARRLLEGRCPDRRIDAFALARLLARRQPFAQVPRLQVNRLAAPVVLLVDDTPTMAAYRDDVDGLAAQLRQLVGDAAVSVERGRVSSPVVDGAAVVLIVSDLRGRLAGEAGADAASWVDVVRRATTRGAVVRLLVPATIGRLPLAEIAAPVVEWSRRTRPADLLRHRPRPRPRRSQRAFRSLAMLLAPATRIEPWLLRSMRHALMPGYGPELEGSLLASTLVDVINMSGFTLKREVRERALLQLARTPERRRRALKLIASAHASGPPLLVVEERLTQLSLEREEGWEAEVLKLLRSVTRGMSPERPGLARWFEQATRRLPPDVTSSRGAAEAAIRAECVLGRTLAAPVDRAIIPQHEVAFLQGGDAPATERLEVVVTQLNAVTEGGLTFYTARGRTRRLSAALRRIGMRPVNSGVGASLVVTDPRDPELEFWRSRTRAEPGCIICVVAAGGDVDPSWRSWAEVVDAGSSLWPDEIAAVARFAAGITRWRMRIRPAPRDARGPVAELPVGSAREIEVLDARDAAVDVRTDGADLILEGPSGVWSMFARGAPIGTVRAIPRLWEARLTRSTCVVFPATGRGATGFVVADHTIVTSAEDHQVGAPVRIRGDGAEMLGEVVEVAGAIATVRCSSDRAPPLALETDPPREGAGLAMMRIGHGSDVRLIAGVARGVGADSGALIVTGQELGDIAELVTGGPLLIEGRLAGVLVSGARRRGGEWLVPYRRLTSQSMTALGIASTEPCDVLVLSLPEDRRRHAAPLVRALRARGLIVRSDVDVLRARDSRLVAIGRRARLTVLLRSPGTPVAGLRSVVAALDSSSSTLLKIVRCGASVLGSEPDTELDFDSGVEVLASRIVGGLGEVEGRALRSPVFAAPRRLTANHEGHEAAFAHAIEVLSRPRAERERVCLVGGLASGESSLALSIARALAKTNCYPGGIFWVSPAQGDLLSYWGSTVADALELPVARVEERASHVLQVIAQGPRALVVLDGVVAWDGPGAPHPLPVGAHVGLLATAERALDGGPDLTSIPLSDRNRVHPILACARIHIDPRQLQSGFLVAPDLLATRNFDRHDPGPVDVEIVGRRLEARILCVDPPAGFALLQLPAAVAAAGQLELVRYQEAMGAEWTAVGFGGPRGEVRTFANALVDGAAARPLTADEMTLSSDQTPPDAGMVGAPVMIDGRVVAIIDAVHERRFGIVTVKLLIDLIEATRSLGRELSAIEVARRDQPDRADELDRRARDLVVQAGHRRMFGALQLQQYWLCNAAPWRIAALVGATCNPPRWATGLGELVAAGLRWPSSQFEENCAIDAARIVQLRGSGSERAAVSRGASVPGAKRAIAAIRAGRLRRTGYLVASDLVASTSIGDISAGDVELEIGGRRHAVAEIVVSKGGDDVVMLRLVRPVKIQPLHVEATTIDIKRSWLATVVGAPPWLVLHIDLRDAGGTDEFQLPVAAGEASERIPLGAPVFVEDRLIGHTARSRRIVGARRVAEAIRGAHGTGPHQQRVQRTLEGHAQAVTACAFTGDGSWLVSTSHDRTIRIWDLATGTSRSIPTPHAHYVYDCAVVPGDGRVVTASEDGTLSVIDPEDLTKLRVLRGHRGAVRACVVSSDGRLIVSASMDRTVRVWDVEGRPRFVLQAPSPVWSCAVTPSGDRVVAVCGDGSLRVWSAEDGKALATVRSPSDDWLCCAVTPDGREVVAGGRRWHIGIFDLATGRMRARPRREGTVWSVMVTPDGRRFVSGGDDGMIEIWDLSAGTRVRRIKAHAGAIYCCLVTPDGEQVVTASEDATLKMLSLGPEDGSHSSA